MPKAKKIELENIEEVSYDDVADATNKFEDCNQCSNGTTTEIPAEITTRPRLIRWSPRLNPSDSKSLIASDSSS